VVSYLNPNLRAVANLPASITEALANAIAKRAAKEIEGSRQARAAGGFGRQRGQRARTAGRLAGEAEPWLAASQQMSRRRCKRCQ
jgi:hypothetical protein